MKKKSEDFNILQLGTSYKLDCYSVIDGKGIDKTMFNLTPDDIESNKRVVEQIITFVRGDKSEKTKVKIEVDYVGTYQNGEREFKDLKTGKTYILNPLEKEDEIPLKVEIIEEVETVVPRVDGILHEQLLGMMIVDLEYKNTLVPNEFTEVAIMNFKSALKQLEFRQQDRELRNVVGTYQK